MKLSNNTNPVSHLMQFILFLCLSGCDTQETLQEPQDFYRNNVLSIVVGVNPGGGFDEYARMVATALSERTGGEVVVENQPGGGTLLALNRLVQGNPDGLSMMLVGGEAMILAQLTDRPGTRFDIRELNFLGRIQKDTPVVLWSATNPERDFQSVLNTMRNTGSIWGASGVTDNISDGEAVMAQALGLSPEQMGIVIGYSGSNETALAAIRGEVDGMLVSSTSAVNYVSFDGKEGLIPIVTLDRERDLRFFPDVPTIFEVAELDEEASWWIDFRARVTAVGRSFVMHKDTPQDRIDYLRNEIQAILTDSTFQDEASRRNRPINYISAEEQQRLVDSILADYSDEKRREVKYVLTEKYIR